MSRSACMVTVWETRFLKQVTLHICIGIRKICKYLPYPKRGGGSMCGANMICRAVVRPDLVLWFTGQLQMGGLYLS
jgi:hypothetical protein